MYERPVAPDRPSPHASIFRSPSLDVLCASNSMRAFVGMRRASQIPRFFARWPQSRPFSMRHAPVPTVRQSTPTIPRSNASSNVSVSSGSGPLGIAERMGSGVAVGFFFAVLAGVSCVPVGGPFGRHAAARHAAKALTMPTTEDARRLTARTVLC